MHTHCCLVLPLLPNKQSHKPMPSPWGKYAARRRLVTLLVGEERACNTHTVLYTEHPSHSSHPNPRRTAQCCLKGGRKEGGSKIYGQKRQNKIDEGPRPPLIRWPPAPLRARKMATLQHAPHRTPIKGLPTGSPYRVSSCNDHPQITHRAA